MVGRRYSSGVSPATPELSPDEVYEIFERAGLHRNVPLKINQVQVEDYTATIDLTLRYLWDKPVCCTDPGCYSRAFNGVGLDEILCTIQARVTACLVLDMLLIVHTDFDPGYEFLAYPHIYRPENKTFEIRFPKDIGSASP